MYGTWYHPLILLTDTTQYYEQDFVLVYCTPSTGVLFYYGSDTPVTSS
jgi:hypothetical protein